MATTERLEVRRTISPYDLTAADNPGAVISHPLLRGSNYDEWACGIKTALISRKKFGFLDGTIQKPNEASSDFEDWLTVNALLVSWIKMTIDPSIKSNIYHRDVAKDLWDHIKRRYAVTSGPRNQQIKSDLANCRQQGMSVEAYYGRLNQIWDRVSSYRPLRTCSCGKCECNLTTLQEKDKEDDMVQQFLFGLDERYFQNIRSSLTARVPLPSLEEAYNLVRQEEDLQQNSRIKEEKVEAMAFAVHSKPRFRPNEKKDYSSTVCKHCNRTGHPSDSCFEILGYPEWWGDRTRSRTSPGIQGRGSGRHSSSASLDRNRLPVYANAVSSAPSSSKERVNRVITDRDRDAVVGLSDEQWETVLHLLNASRNGASETLTGMISKPSWILDTGASHHMTGKLDSLFELRDMPPVLVILADGTERISVKEGTVSLGSHLILKSVFYVEEMQSDLISLGQLMDENRCVVQLADQFLVIQDRITRMVTGFGKREDGTFYFLGIESLAAVSTRVESYELWHNRMGHPSAQGVSLIPDIVVSPISNKACDTCFRAKQTRDSFPLSNNKTTHVFELVHTDVWGPYRTLSSSGARYFLTIVDDYPRSVWIYLMAAKGETKQHLQNSISMVERQFNTLVKTIRSDNGSEFMCLASFFCQKGIRHETSCVGTPNQNGRVERKHRHILNVARALRFQAHLPILFWGECILTARYLINRTPSSVLNGKTPYEKLYQASPPVNHLRVFGSLCYAHNQNTKGGKFDSRTRRCIFVGYPHGQKGWRLYDLEKHEFFVSRDVKFMETEFPYKQQVEGHEEDDPAVLNLWDSHSENSMLLDSLNNTSPTTHSRPIESHVLDQSLPTTQPEPDVDALPNSQTEDPRPTSTIDETLTSAPTIIDKSLANPPIIDVAPSSSVAATDNPIDNLGRGHRRKVQPVKLREYVTNTVSIQPSQASTYLSKSRYPITSYVNCDRFSASHRAFQVAITSAVEPRSYSHAVKNELWRKAMKAEIDAFELNKTWSLTTLPKGKKAIGSKWVYKGPVRLSDASGCGCVLRLDAAARRKLCCLFDRRATDRSVWTQACSLHTRASNRSV